MSCPLIDIIHTTTVSMVEGPYVEAQKYLALIASQLVIATDNTDYTTDMTLMWITVAVLRQKLTILLYPIYGHGELTQWKY